MASSARRCLYTVRKAEAGSSVHSSFDGNAGSLLLLVVESNCCVLNRDYSMYLFTSKGFYYFHTHILC